MSTPPEEPHQGLLFRWRAPEGVALRLAMWSGGAVLGLTVLLLMFEVVYPPPSRRPHTTQRITLLDPASPKSREIIQAATDRNFLLLAPNANGSPRLADLRPVFSPGFKEYQLQVKDLPEPGSTASSVPKLFSADHPLLPPVKSAKSPPNPSGANALKLVAQPSGGLEGRRLVHDVEPLPKDSPALSEINARFRVAVSPDGRVITAVSLMDESTETSAAASRSFLQAMSQLRFAPTQTQGPQWGLITFRWKGAGS